MCRASLWNQPPGSIKNDNACVMGLVGSLWNPDIQTQLQRIHERVARQADSGEPSAKRSPVQFRRHRMGLIPDAITAVLAEHEDGLRVRDIAAAVTARLGESIPRSSIKSCLSREAGSASGAFERLGRGHYRLR